MGSISSTLNDFASSMKTSCSPSRSACYTKDSKERNKFKDVPGTVNLKRNGRLPRIYREDGQRVYRLGELPGYGGKKSLQDFISLRDQCLSEERLFEDPDFPPVDTSVYSNKNPTRSLKWLRPSEIAANPQLFVNGFSRFDVKQGEVGNCWVVAAMATLTLHKTLFYQVVPDDQSFDDKYAGIFHFRFWQDGRWVDVVIDDRLPTYGGQMVFVHSGDKNEFWSGLLEKAYAKLYGSYDVLAGGSTNESLEDFTGGISEVFNLEETKLDPLFYKKVFQGYQRGSLLCCSILPKPNEKPETTTAQNLIKGHAYSITGMCYVDVEAPCKPGRIQLFRIRNPWGRVEWNGAWSDNSPEWKCIKKVNKKKIGLTVDEDGEFWMSYEDFTAKFTNFYMCHLNPDVLDRDSRKGQTKKWKIHMFEGDWVRGVTAGGSSNNLDTYPQNPQYTLTLTNPDEDDDGKLCTVIVSLMLKNWRIYYKLGRSVIFRFSIYKEPKSNQLPLQYDFFKNNKPMVVSKETKVSLNLVYTMSREVISRFKLPPGTYCIIPSTLNPNEEAEFLLRVFTETDSIIIEKDKEIGIGIIDKRAIEVGRQLFTSDKSVKEAFLKVAGDDGELDWLQLKGILDYAMRKETHGQGFSKETCRSMVAMMDMDCSGKLGYEELMTFWEDICKHKAVFGLYDTEETGRIPSSLLRDVLRSSGYIVSNRILCILGHRYGSKDGFIEFDDFLMCIVRFKSLIDIFYENADPKSMLTATFTFEEWLKRTIYS